MQGRYSRSKEGLRESFLQLLKEDTENYDVLVDEIKKTAGGSATSHAVEKAIKFMEKWVLGYGHSSIAEGAVVGLCLENVSILATKVIEDNRLSSFCEKSTRYVSFERSSFYIDKNLEKSEFSKDIKELLDFLFEIYTKLQEPVLDYVKKTSPLEGDTNASAWERACASRRFDAIRYLLPTCTKTSLGWTINARQLSYAISKLLSHPLREINEIGEQVKKEASKVLPSLLKFSDKSNYFVETEKEMRDSVSKISIEKTDSDRVVLIKGPENEDMVVASIIYKYKNDSFDSILSKVKAMTLSEKEKVFDSYLEKMGDFDYPLRELEHSLFTFDIIMDYGAFRDLQRHRMCTQTNTVLTTDLGYDTPKDIINAGVEEDYKKAMEKAKEVYDKVKDKYPLEAQYILPLGFRKRFLVSMNLREIYHLVKIRTTPMAHDSYRRIAYKVYELVKEKYPLLAKYIVCNYSQEELGRLKSEEKTEARKNLTDW
jgi:thymidylate synthase ThyX